MAYIQGDWDDQFKRIGIVCRLRIEDVIRDSDVDNYFIKDQQLKATDRSSVETVIDDLVYLMTNFSSPVQYVQENDVSYSDTVGYPVIPANFTIVADQMTRVDNIIITKTSSTRWSVQSLTRGNLSEQITEGTQYPTGTNYLGLTIDIADAGDAIGTEVRITTASVDDGDIQTFFRDYLTYILPSNSSPTISDDFINPDRVGVVALYENEVGPMIGVVRGSVFDDDSGTVLSYRNAQDYILSDYYKTATNNTYLSVYDIVQETNRILATASQNVQENTNSISDIESDWTEVQTALNDSDIVISSTQMAQDDDIRLERISTAGTWQVFSKIRSQLPEALIEGTAYPVGRDYAGFNLTLPTQIDFDSGAGQLYRDEAQFFGSTGSFLAESIINGGLPSTNMSRGGELYGKTTVTGGTITIYFHKSQAEMQIDATGTRVSEISYQAGDTYAQMTELNSSGLTGTFRVEHYVSAATDDYVAFHGVNIQNTDGGRDGYDPVLEGYTTDLSWHATDASEGFDKYIGVTLAPYGMTSSQPTTQIALVTYEPTDSSYYDESNMTHVVIEDTGADFAFHAYKTYEQAYTACYNSDYTDPIMTVTGVAASATSAVLTDGVVDLTIYADAPTYDISDWQDGIYGPNSKSKLVFGITVPKTVITDYYTRNDPLNLISGNLNLHNITGIDKGVNSDADGTLYCAYDEYAESISMFKTVADRDKYLTLGGTGDVATISNIDSSIAGDYTIDEEASSGLGGTLNLNFIGFTTNNFTSNNGMHYGCFFDITPHPNLGL